MLLTIGTEFGRWSATTVEETLVVHLVFIELISVDKIVVVHSVEQVFIVEEYCLFLYFSVVDIIVHQELKSRTHFFHDCP